IRDVKRDRDVRETGPLDRAHRILTGLPARVVTHRPRARRRATAAAATTGTRTRRATARAAGRAAGAGRTRILAAGSSFAATSGRGVGMVGARVVVAAASRGKNCEHRNDQFLHRQTTRGFSPILSLAPASRDTV